MTMIKITTNEPRVSRLTKGRRLQFLLQKNERSVSWLSRKLGVSNTAIHKWINNKVNINVKWITKINHLFNLDEEYWV